MHIMRPIICLAALPMTCALMSQQVVAKDFAAASEVLRRACISCHGADLQMSGLRLDRREDILNTIDPGDSESSLLIQRITDRQFGILMPPAFDLSSLPKKDLNTLKAWIDNGAQWPAGTTLTLEEADSSEQIQVQQIRDQIRNGNFENALKSLEQKPGLVRVRDHNRSTLLHAACLYGNSDLVEQFIELGADVNARTVDGITPLMLGVRDPEIVESLLKAGASKTGATTSGRTTLEIAASYAGNVDVLEQLLPDGPNRQMAINKSLQQAARILDHDMIALLIRNGGQANLQTMRRAGWQGDVEFIESLIPSVSQDQRQAALNAALEGASLQGKESLVTSLLELGADPNAGLCFAVYSEYSTPGLVQTLLEAGAETDRKARLMRFETTLLKLAKRRGDPIILGMLDKENPDVERLQQENLEELKRFKISYDSESIKAAVSRGISLLQPCDEVFFANTGCIACHQQSVTALAVAEALRHGIKVDETAANRELDLVRIALKNMKSRRLQRTENPFAQPATVGLYALAFDAQGYETDEFSDAMIIDMAGRQTASGYWVAFSHRPPIEFSKIKSTAFAIKAMQLYGPPALRNRFDKQIAAAREWMVRSEPIGNEEEVFRLLGLFWAEANDQYISEQYDRLSNLQQPDGGWRQLPHLETDAYATSMALYALSESGMKPSGPVYQQGVRYLMSTQKPDGSWYVRSRSEPVQDFFESGFPHGTDQWISATATGWASIVLLKSLPD